MKKLLVLGFVLMGASGLQAGLYSPANLNCRGIKTRMETVNEQVGFYQDIKERTNGHVSWRAGRVAHKLQSANRSSEKLMKAMQKRGYK